MEDMNSIWNFQESVEELKQKLLSTTVELENYKLEAGEVIRKNKEDVKQLIQLLDMIYLERDEARNQLHNLLNQFYPSADYYQGISDSPLMITESNSFSDTYSFPSHTSSPYDPFLDTVTSPEFSNMKDLSSIAYVNQQFTEGSNMIPSGILKIDQACLVIEELVKGKPLPQRGRFLKAVNEAGPILQNLLLAGPLPRWRNPPQMDTALHIPPVSIKGNAPNSGYIVASGPYAERSCAVSSQVLSTLDVGNGISGSNCGNDMLMTACANANSHVTLCKKQKLC